ncbi:MAG: hypothetical protein ACI9TH_003986 [Kiritimatiellia bacterium]|jgi:hypothetical protein
MRMQLIKRVKWTARLSLLAGSLFLFFVYVPAQAEKQAEEKKPAEEQKPEVAAADTDYEIIEGTATNTPAHIVEAPAPSAVKDGIEGAVDFDVLKTTVLNRKPPPVYTTQIQNLDGKKIKIVGFMGPYDDFENLKNFMLFNKPVGCNFCQPPSVKEVVMVRQKVDTAKFIDAPILVEGTLRLWSEGSKDEGHENGFLYVMEDALVVKYEPAKK